MASHVVACGGAPPCFRMDDAGVGEIPDPRLFPVIPRQPACKQVTAADLSELDVCRKLGDPYVRMTVRESLGRNRGMTPAERERTYGNRWFTRLVRRARIVRADDLGEWECCALCNNCHTPVYLVNPHAGVQDAAHHCPHFVCLTCLLRAAFRQRGFGQTPSCPFCRGGFDEDQLTPVRLVRSPGD
jgi:hypothetical protein